jgi:serine/threonine protein kinase
MIVKHCEKLSIQYRTQSKERWSIVERLGTMNGGLNSGIAKTKAKTAPGMVFIEKRFGGKHFKHKVPHREIQMLHQVNDHKNIAMMVDHFLDESTQMAAVYLEYCNLGSLDAVVAQVADGKHVNEHKVWNWFIQLTQAVAYLHRGPHPEYTDDQILQSGWSRMFHRDIKPGNILLNARNGQIVAKLADFGCAISEDYLALESDEDYAITQSMYTNGFDPPEHPYFSGASDIWQLGISMMCLCTGIVRPWSGNNPEGEVWDEQRPAGVPYSKGLSLSMVLCLEKDRKKRITVCAMLKTLTTAYEERAYKLHADADPSKVFEPKETQGSKAPQSSRVRGNDQNIPVAPVPQMAVPIHAHQMPVASHAQPVRLGQGLRTGNIMHLMNDYGYPVPQAHLHGSMEYLYPPGYGFDDDDDNDDVGYYVDPRLSQGFNPMYNPRRRKFR